MTGFDPSRISIHRRAQEALLFAAVAGVYLLHLFLAGYDRFYYDASLYWQLGDSFEQNGHFSLVAYSGAGYHGYSLPLALHGLKAVGSWFDAGSVTTVKVAGALLAATLGVLVAPRIARRLFPGAATGWGRILLFNALLFVFWRDYFDFPLSDFPSLVLAGAGLLALLRGGALGYLVAGLTFALASNMRPAYQPALIVCFAVALALPLRRGWEWQRRGAQLALVAAGAFAALFPQMLINHHHRGSWTPTVPDAKGIALQQLSDGLIAQKYETYVGPLTKYPQPEVFFFDPATQHVVREEHLSTSTIELGQYVVVSSYTQYLGIAVRHPFELAAAYLRRVFNGLDVRYPTPYVRDLQDTSLALSLLEYSLLFAAAALLVVPGLRRGLGRVHWLGLAVLVSPILTVIPSEAESRYFLPLQLLVYMLVSFGLTRPTLRAAAPVGVRVALGVTYAAFVLVCLTLSNATWSHLQHPFGS